MLSLTPCTYYPIASARQLNYVAATGFATELAMHERAISVVGIRRESQVMVHHIGK